MIANVIAARARDLVGPFTFLDEMNWKEGRFPKVRGDDVEFVPLPD